MIFKFKIISVLILAFVASSLLSNTIFIAGTPTINEPFIAELRNSPGIFFTRTGEYFASIRMGKQGVEEYQKRRNEEYVAKTNPGFTPPEAKKEALVADGYHESSPGVYQKTDEAVKTLYINISADAKFEKRMITIDGQQVEALIQL